MITPQHNRELTLCLALVIAILCSLVARGGWVIGFSPSNGADVNGCTGYSCWSTPTNVFDWRWEAQTTRWDGTNMTLPNSLVGPRYLAITSDIQLPDGSTTNSPKGVLVLFDTNRLNKLRPLVPPAGAPVIYWKD